MITWLRGLRDRYKDLLEQYGRVALTVYLTLFGLTLVGFMIAFDHGFELEGAMGGAGTWGAAYLATKATQPLRILATLAVTPLVARLMGHVPKTPERPEGQ